MKQLATIVDKRTVGVDSGPRLRDMVAKVVQECQNGVVSRVLLTGAAAGGEVGPDHHRIAAAMEELAQYAEAVGAALQRRPDGLDLLVPRAVVTIESVGDVMVVAGHRREPALAAVLPWTTPPERFERLLAAACGRDDGLLGRLLSLDRWGAWELADLIAAVGNRPLDVPTGAQLRALVRHDSHLVATLASEVLNRAGEPAVPQFVMDHDPARVNNTRQRADGTFTEEWAARIDVDEYAFYEATHPGYAEQVRVLAHMIRRLAGSPPRILDVGSGPGLPTIMLSELFEHTTIDAVEPSSDAFPYLCHAVAGRPIIPHHCGVADFPGAGRYPVIVSVGSSHHLDTRVFLESLRRLVQPGGLVVVADEMIAPFTNGTDRAHHLIDHHFSYIDEALAHVVPDTLPRVEQRRLQAFRAVDRHEPGTLHRLLWDVSQNRVPHPGQTSPWQRVRFAVLELEALVAGIDYDVERKTFPANFMAMARDAGLETLEHRRVHATVGDDELDAGTHVVALWRPE